ncbi:caspase family protein (plasmid) [Agrobacterium leguminum]|uniref:caspase family protein n=1 Tax=Agrobacterium leguminum TaxID=2792015 RepID=UPI00272D0A1C|nr:caspase family protein [Agrobacterium leguminum]WLE01019.1 caspase family protein [Agrobacterium leguminum]
MLRIDPEKPGRWIEIDAVDNGAHVMIVGISAYPHLAGGDAVELASDNGGLGQLELSALTSAKLFAALKSMGSIAGCRIKSCRLALAPSEAELSEVDALTDGHYASACFEPLRALAIDWARDIRRDGRKQSENVALFFFSGHGVEHLGSPALLSSDILNPDDPNRADLAISHDGLVRAIKTYGIDRGLFLIDACRNAPEISKRLHIVGSEILQPDPDQSKSPEAMLSLLSTRQLFQSYQVRGAGQTIFGQALLEALDGVPPDYRPYDGTSDPLTLRFGRLESHVKQRVRELLLEQTATRLQPVTPAGDPYDGEMLVAVKALPADGASAAEPFAANRGIENLIASRSANLTDEYVLTSERTISAIRKSSQAKALSDLSNFDIMDQIFGDDDVADTWIDSVRVLSIASGSVIDASAVTVTQAWTNAYETSVSAWIDLMIAPGAGDVVWISTTRSSGSELSVAIPRDLLVATPIRLDIDMQLQPGEGWVVDGLSARLGPPSTDDQIWTQLQDVQNAEILTDLGSAGRMAVRRDILGETLREKRQSPVAAAIAGSILLRSGHLEDLHDWPRNLANWYEWLPDGALLWAEALIRRYPTGRAQGRRADSVADLANTAAYAEARRYFSKLGERGVPLLSANTSLAIGQLPFWRRLLESDSLDAPDKHALARSCAVIESAAEAFISGGLFTGFSQSQRILPPELLLGRRQRRRYR